MISFMALVYDLNRYRPAMVISMADIRRIGIQRRPRRRRRRRSLKNLVSYSRMIEPRHAVRNTVVVRQRIHVVECIVTDYILNHHTRPLRLSVSIDPFNARCSN